MAYWLCETCNGCGTLPAPHRRWRQWWERVTCPDCKGDGHARPPKGKPEFRGSFEIDVFWLALQVIAEPGDDLPYPVEIIGLFETEVDAVTACRDPTDCIGPLAVGEVLPREMVDWPGAYYPLAGN